MTLPLAQAGLDPHDWSAFRAQSHRMLDDMLSYIETIRDRPVWQAPPEQTRARFRQRLPKTPRALEEVHASFMEDILPYAIGNVHPGFMGWVHGGGTPVGMLADMLAAGLNANLGGRDQMPIEVERQVVQWMRELFGFPASASGLFVTGTSIANFIALLIARTSVQGVSVRRCGIGTTTPGLVAYASAGAHGCIAQAMDMAGLGSDALRLIPMNDQYQMDVKHLIAAIRTDRDAGYTPLMVVGTAGSVDVGAIDDLSALATICAQEGIWFHVDGAYGALAMLSPKIAPRLAGIECADSLAFDFHKWGQVPYDAGFILVRDEQKHLQTFASPAAYLRRETRGMAAGSPWPCDFGPDLSRGFRALKTWFAIQVYGADRIGEVIAGTCDLAQYLADCIAASPVLELIAPVTLNIVCFRFLCDNADLVNAQIVVALQEGGIVAPSTTMIDGKWVIRAALVNHRTAKEDIDALVALTISLGGRLAAGRDAPMP